jgi:RNA polymerase sigma-70 factor (ECF subfamily)
LSEIDAPLKALMLRGLAGDTGAYAELLSRMSVHLRRYFARKLGSGDADVEDLVQDTLLTIHLRRDTWDATLPLTPWAYAIAHYKLIDQLRRRRVRYTEPIEAAESVFAGDDGDALARLDIDRLLGGLPERQRQVLSDVKLGGFSTAEAARKSGMSESAVKVSVHRSLKALIRRVRDENG